MSALLMRWCNDALGLSRPVTNFERDFSNGYLLGEVLAKFNQQPDFDAFRDSDKSNAKINNFCRLEPTLRRMRIKFDSKMAFQLMKGQRGAANKLLYQVKMGIEALGSATVGRTREGTVAALAHTTTRMSKPVYDRTIHNHFEKSIRALAANQNQVYMDRHLKKFTDAGRRHAEEATRANDSVMWEMQTRKLETRQQRIHAVRREHDVMHDAQEQGIREWERNQEIRLAQQYMSETYAAKAAQKRETRKLLTTMDEENEVRGGIDEFERRIAAQFGVDTKAAPAPEHVVPDSRTYDQYVEDLENQVPDAATMASDAAAYIASLHARVAERRLMAAARDKRKQRFVVERTKAQEELRTNAHNDALLAMLSKKTQAEAELDTRLATIRKYPAVFTENRAFRERQYANQRAADSDLAFRRDDTNYAIMTTQHERDCERHAERRDECLGERRSVHRGRHTDWCRDTVLRAVETAMVVARQRELRKDQVPEDVARELRLIFATGLGAQAGVPVPDRLMVEPATTGSDGGDDDDDAGGDGGAVVATAVPSVAPAIASAGLVGAAEDGGVYAASGRNRDVTGVVLASAQDDEAKAGGQASEDAVAARAAARAAEAASQEQLAATAVLDAAAYDLYVSQQDVWAPPDGVATPDLAVDDEDDGGGGGKKGGKKKGGGGLPVLDPEYAHTHVQIGDGAADGRTEWLLGAVARAVEQAADPPVPHAPLPPVPRFAVRAVMVGAPFAGKSVQAPLVAERLQLRVLSPEVLLTEALAIASNGGKTQEEAEESVGAPGSARFGGFANDDVAQAWREEAATVGAAALQVLQDGGVVPDELYVQLIVAAIRGMGTSWGRADDGAFNALPEADSRWRGWLLDGFPSTAAQAALLEEALTGWTPPTPPAVSTRQRWANALAPSLPPPRHPLTVDTPYGVNAALHVVLSPERATRRALGRRTDPATGTEYHIDRNPPPHDVVMKHLLQEVSDRHNRPATLPDHTEAAWSNLPGVEAWYSRNPAQLRRVNAAEGKEGDATTGTGTAAARGILDEEPLCDMLVAEVEAAVAADVAPAVLSASPQDGGYPAPASSANDGTPGDADEGKGEATDGSEGKGADDDGSEGKGADEAGEGAPAAGAGAGAGAGAAAPATDDSKQGDGAEEATVEKETAEESKGETESKGEKETAEESNGEKETAEESKGEKETAGAGLLPPVEDTSRLATAASPWNAAVERFGGGVEAELQALRVEEAAATERLAVTRRRFDQFVRRAAPRKQELLVAFQQDFNALDSELRFQDLVKDELHMRTEETAQAMWNVVRTRRAAAQAELDALRGDPWLLEVQTCIANHYLACAQLEVDRFAASRKVLIEYFSAASGRTPVAQPEEGIEAQDTGLTDACIDISGWLAPPEEDDGGKGKKGKKKDKKKKDKKKGKKGGEEDEEEEGGQDPCAALTAAVQRGYSAAKAALAGVDALVTVQNSLREAAAKEEEERLAALAEPEEAASKKKDKKKKGKKGKKGGAAEEELVVPEVFLPAALVDGPAFTAIKYEVQQLCKRLASLEALSRQACATLADRTAALWQELQGMVDGRFDREAAAVEAFVQQAREAIEAETTLPLTLELQREYFIVDHARRVIAIPPPPQPKVLENADATRLAPSQVATLASALRSAAAAAAGTGAPRTTQHGRRLPLRAFAAVCARLAAAGKLPAAWGELPASTLRTLGATMDATASGLIDWRRFVYAAACFSLPALTEPPSLDELQDMRTAFAAADDTGSGRVAPSACNSVTLWFEKRGDLWRPDALPAAEGKDGQDGGGKASDDDESQLVSATAAANLVRRAFLQGLADSDGLVNYRRLIALWSIGATAEESLLRGVAATASETDGSEPAATADDLAHLFPDTADVARAASFMQRTGVEAVSASALLAQASDEDVAALLAHVPVVGVDSIADTICWK